MSDQNLAPASDQGTQTAPTSTTDVSGNVENQNVSASQDTSLNGNAEQTLDSNAEKATRAKYAQLERDNNELRRKANELAQSAQLVGEINSMLEEDKELYAAFEKRAKARRGEIVETKDEPLKDNKSSKESGGIIDEKKIEKIAQNVVVQQKDKAEFNQAVAEIAKEFPELSQEAYNKADYLGQQAISDKIRRVLASANALRVAGNSWTESLRKGVYFQPEYSDKYFENIKKDATLAKKASDISNGLGSESGFAGSSGTGGADDTLTPDEVRNMRANGLDPTNAKHKEVYIRIRNQNN